LVKTCTPRAPSWVTARSISAKAASTPSSATAATKAGKRSGWRAQSSAMPSLAIRARRCAVAPEANSSIGGLGSETTCR
jgi:hypothetical protein